MIINNAASRRDVDFWTKHLQNRKENDRAELRDIRGLAADNLHDALLEMQLDAKALPRLQNFMYHADFNPARHERLTDEQWERAFEIFEQERGIPSGQPRVVFEHEKDGRIHRHVIWSRVDHENRRATPDGLDWKVAHTAARKIEKGLGLDRTIGPLDREPGTPRPKRAPEPWEMYRGMKTGIDPRDIAAEVTELFHQSRTGKEFQAAIEQRGYQLLKGDRRGFVILDSAGNDHSLARRLDGINTKELNAFMRDVNRETLPTVEQGKTLYRERKIAGLEADRDTVRREIEWEEALAQAAIEKEKVARQFVEPKEARAGRQEKEQGARAGRPLDESVAGIRLAFALSQSPNGFARNLDEAGFKLARVTKAEAERSHINSAFAKEIDRFAPEYKEGELVAINEHGHVYGLNARTTGKTRGDIEAFMRTLDTTKIEGIEATQQQVAAYKRPVPPREFFPPAATVTGGIPMQMHSDPLTPWQKVGRASREASERDVAPEHLHGAGAEIWLAYKRSDNARAFVAALEDRDISVARVTGEDVINSSVDRFYAADLNTPRRLIPPKLREGDYVAIAEDGRIFNLNYRTTGDRAERVQKFMAPLNKQEFPSVATVLKTVQERAEQLEIERQAFRDLSAGKMKQPIDPRPTGRLGRAMGVDYVGTLHKTTAASATAGKKTLRTVGKTLEAIADMVESLAAPVLTPEQLHDAEKAKDKRAARAEETIAFSRYDAEHSQRRQDLQERHARDRERERDR